MLTKAYLNLAVQNASEGDVFLNEGEYDLAEQSYANALYCAKKALDLQSFDWTVSKDELECVIQYLHMGQEEAATVN